MFKPIFLQLGYNLVPDRNVWLRKQFEKSGPTYVKIGQFISSRGDIFGKDLSDEMSLLQDSVESLPWEELQTFVDTSKFEYVNKVALASASVAQIHRARTRNGRDVVLKIKKPKADILRSDISSIKACLDALAVFPFLESNKVMPWVEEIDRAISKELDFRNEILNIQNFNTIYRYDDSILTPQVYPSMCTDNVIVMDYVPSSSEGFNSTKVINTFIEQIIFEGVIHGDLHGGNLGFQGDKLVLYDFGNIIYIDKSYQSAMRKFIMALQMKDTEKTIDAMGQMGMNVRDKNGTRIFIKKFFKYLDTLDITNFKFDPDEIVDKVPVEIDSTTFTIIRSFSLLEGLCKKKNPGFDYNKIFIENMEMLYLDSNFLVELLTEATRI